MNWLQRVEHIHRKHLREVKRRNVRAYRERQKQAGVHRLDVSLDEQRYAILRELMLPGETVSATFGRLLDSVTGNTSLLNNIPVKPSHNY